MCFSSLSLRSFSLVLVPFPYSAVTPQTCLRGCSSSRSLHHRCSSRSGGARPLLSFCFLSFGLFSSFFLSVLTGHLKTVFVEDVYSCIPPKDVLLRRVVILKFMFPNKDMFLLSNRLVLFPLY